MHHLWRLKLSQCSYETLQFEFVNFFGTNDPRTVNRYIGAPPRNVEWKGDCLRQNMMRGSVAKFHYSNNRQTSRKLGLMEILGYITLKPEILDITQGTVHVKKSTGKWLAVIHHARMLYHTKQMVLENSPFTQEGNEEESLSKPIMCVSSLSCQDRAFSQGEGSEGNRFEKVPLDVETTAREEEVISSTHTHHWKDWRTRTRGS
jgi:hypothetical protein